MPGTFLLDTHTFIWLMDSPALVPARVRQRLADPSSQLVVSAVVCWEVATKFSLGKLSLPGRIAVNVERAAAGAGYGLLPITFAHAQRSASLPWHHKDPFDRLLIAQAIVEQLTLVSNDGKFDRYSIDRFW
jgi:PIN domain nuclease of toxin-antitoxin system